jgi:hypothetical protein
MDIPPQTVVLLKLIGRCQDHHLLHQQDAPLALLASMFGGPNLAKNSMFSLYLQQILLTQVLEQPWQQLAQARYVLL